MAGSIEGKFRLLHTVKDNERLGAIAGRLGIKSAGKKGRVKGASGKTYIVEEVKGNKPTKNRREEP